MAIQFDLNALSRFSNVNFGDNDAIANLDGVLPFKRNVPRGCTGRWRREGDSNPRYGFTPYDDLANRCLQPLSHLS